MPARPPPLPPPSHDAAIRARFLDEVNSTVEELTHPAATPILIGLALTGVLLPFAVSRWRERRRARRLVPVLRHAIEFARRATPVLSYPLMVNSMLRSPGDKLAPGLVLMSLDPAAQRVAYMAELAIALGSSGEEGDTTHWSEQDEDFAIALMLDEQYKPFRRRAIPASITRGPTVYACDLVIEPGLLPGRHISDDAPFVPCMAEPGDSGRILHIPYWMFPPQVPATEDQKSDFLVSLVHFHELSTAAPQTR